MLFDLNISFVSGQNPGHLKFANTVACTFTVVTSFRYFRLFKMRIISTELI
jgi:hypothetical protein